MAISRRFVVKKEAHEETITYMEYEKLKGFNVKPKDSLLIEDMINVNEMIVINPGLIEKLVSKKCKRRLEKIILMLSVVYGDEASDDGAIEMVLDEMEKFKTMLRKKYKDYLKKEEYKLYLKKIEILESEARIRINEKRREIQEERGRRGR
jgi:D-serine dehydratase